MQSLSVSGAGALAGYKPRRKSVNIWKILTSFDANTQMTQIWSLHMAKVSKGRMTSKVNRSYQIRYGTDMRKTSVQSGEISWTLIHE